MSLVSESADNNNSDDDGDGGGGDHYGDGPRFLSENSSARSNNQSDVEAHHKSNITYEEDNNRW